MLADEYLRAGRVEDCLIALQQSVRDKPEDVRSRASLFELLCVLGQWDRALTQLEVLAQLNAETLVLARLLERVISCEVLRADIFAGKRAPIVFGEPEAWVSSLIQANQLAAQGEFTAAAELRDQAFEAAAASPGTIGESRFNWIADADTRLGPVLEVMLEGAYYWVPFSRVQRIEIKPPKDLRDLVWTKAMFTWANGGEAGGYIPTRYPGTESCADGQLRLARKTEWIEQPEGHSFGLGQRIWTTDEAEYPLLEVRSLELSQPQPSAPVEG